MTDGAEALHAMESRAIREAKLETYTSNLGSMALLLATMLWLTLPSLWNVINGEWNTTLQPSVLTIAGNTLLEPNFVCNFVPVADGMW